LSCFRNADLERPRTLTSASPPGVRRNLQKGSGNYTSGELLRSSDERSDLQDFAV
jgi:hypothetical protein